MGILGAAPVASASTGCAFDGARHQLTVTHPDGIDTVTIRTVPNALDPGQARAIAVLQGETALDCGAPTTAQVDTISYVNAGGVSDLIVEEPRRFAPGFTPEGAGDPEIEFSINEAAGILGEVMLRDGDGVADRYVAGTGGVNVDPADPVDDADVVLTNTFFTQLALEGGAGADVFSAAGGEGTGAATDRKVRFAGAAGADTLTGGAAGDEFDGGPGDDVIAGGGSADEAVYADAAGPVQVDLQDPGPQRGDSMGRDTLSSIEEVSGSAFADTLRGTSGANFIFGDDGDDLIEGRGGDDLLDPDDGVDTVSYESAGAPVAVDLAVTAPQDTGGAGVDRFYETFDDVIGSAGADVLRGTTGANVMTGGAGTDILAGLEGNDTLLTRDGAADIADCGAGADEAVADPGGLDTLTACETVTTGVVAPPVATPAVPIPLVTGRRAVVGRLGGARAQRLRGGGVTLTVACRAASCVARVRASVVVRLGSRARTLALVPVRVRIPAGATRTVRLRLRRADLLRVRAALADGRRPVVRATVTLAGGAPALRRAITIGG